IEEIISSGRGEKHKAAFWKSVADEVRMSKAGMKDSGLESYVKTEFKKEGVGTVIKVKIISTRWDVSKNHIDIPIAKYLNFEVVYKKSDGTCHLVKTVQITRDYQGGGKYGSKKVTVYPSTHEMNCANVNK
ncbi:MAG: hypothetical protein JKY54_04830, partial [Flavobacteriales bacterium]|nr:hypothetical protein [Flavobacteriales bacterium]